MKKYLIYISLIGLLTAVLLFPVGIAKANGSPDGCEITRDVGVSGCTTGYCSFADANSSCGMCCVLQTIYNITDWIFIFLVALTTVMVIYGAFLILTAGDSDDKLGSGRKYILFAAVGLLVAFLAKAVPQVVRMISGFNK